MPRPKKDAKPKLKNGLYRNPGGEHWLYHFRFRGKVYKGTTKTAIHAEAVAYIMQIKRRLNEEFVGLREPEPPQAPTLREVAKIWDAKKRSSVSKTHARYMAGVVEQHTHSWIDKPITDLNNAAISTLKDKYMSSEGAGHKKGGGHTVRKHTAGGWNKVLVQLRALCGFAVQEGLIQERPFEAKGQWLKPAPKASGFLWPEQVQAFLAAVDSMRKHREGDPVCHPGIYVRLMLGLGLREGEALQLEWDRVDWRREVVTVAASRTTEWKPKDRDCREIQMPAWLTNYLRAWWEFNGRPSRGVLIPAKDSKPHTEGTTKRAIAKGAAALEIVGLTPHSLRATFATTMWEAGVPLEQIAQMLGHEDPDTTLAHYIRRRPKDQVENQARAAALMGF